MHDSMYPIFIAHGPAFKKSHRVESFNNVDIYPLMCFVLGIKPGVNNGSLENVLDLLHYKAVEKNANICKRIWLKFNFYLSMFLFCFAVLLLLSIIPMAILVTTIVFMFVHRRNQRHTASNYDGYSSLLTSEEPILGEN